MSPPLLTNQTRRFAQLTGASLTATARQSRDMLQRQRDAPSRVMQQQPETLHADVTVLHRTSDKNSATNVAWRRMSSVVSMTWRHFRWCNRHRELVWRYSRDWEDGEIWDWSQFFAFATASCRRPCSQGNVYQLPIVVNSASLARLCTSIPIRLSSPHFKRFQASEFLYQIRNRHRCEKNSYTVL